MQGKGTQKGKRIIEPFDYRGIMLDDGRLERQFDQVRDFYLSIPNDDLLHGYRERAGLSAPGVELGGWYTKDAGNVFPQILSGLAAMYAATGDPACLEKAGSLLAEWGKCIGPDGYFFYSWHPTSWQYFYEKMVGALVDMRLYCGSKESLGYLETITDWAVQNLDCTRDYANACGDPREERHRWGEWYTVSENLYRAYMLTGDVKYRDFAEVWEYKEYWDLFADKSDIFGVRQSGGQTLSYHAYSHVNTFSSAAAAYLVKSDEYYLNVLKNAYDYLQAHQVYATGGYGPNEELIPPERFLISLTELPNHFEVQCGSWAAFKMCRYLISFTGDAKYGDWIERLVYNGIGADIPMSPDGRVFYYAHYHLGGAKKVLYPDGWACCTGSRPMAVAAYHDLIYFKDERSIYANLYIPSVVKWNNVMLRQSTRFPESPDVEFTVSTDEPVRFSIKLRVPGWLQEPMVVSVNGERVHVQVDPAHWVVIEREWKDGDRLHVTLPMAFWLSHLDGEGGGFPAAVMYGPVAMAFRSTDGSPASRIDFNDLEHSLVHSPGEPLTYRLASDPGVLLRPFYTFKEGEPYFLYLDPTASN